MQSVLHHSRAGLASFPASLLQTACGDPVCFTALSVPMTLLLQLVRSTLNSVDESGTLQCVVHLPNNSIFLQQLEQLQSTLQDLIGKYEQQLSRVSAGALCWSGGSRFVSASFTGFSLGTSLWWWSLSLRSILSIKGKFGTILMVFNSSNSKAWLVDVYRSFSH